jgi:hypothetical protein
MEHTVNERVQMKQIATVVAWGFQIRMKGLNLIGWCYVSLPQT